MKLLPDKAPVRTATASLPETAAATVQVIDPLAVANWDALALALPGHSFFHSSAWARTLEETYGYKPLYFAKVENGGLRALLPVTEVDSWLTGKRGVSLPFSDVCEGLGNDIGELFEEAVKVGSGRAWKNLETRGPVGGALRKASPYQSFYGHSLELSRDEEKIFAGFESAVQRAIR